MGIRQLIERALLEGYATSELNMKTVFVCIGLTALLALYIMLISTGASAFPWWSWRSLLLRSS